MYFFNRDSAKLEMPWGLFYYEETFFPMLVTLIVINKELESAGQRATDRGCLQPTQGQSLREGDSRVSKEKYLCVVWEVCSIQMYFLKVSLHKVYV